MKKVEMTTKLDILKALLGFIIAILICYGLMVWIDRRDEK